MRHFKNLTSKTDHYKKNIPGFAVDRVIVLSQYDADMQKKIKRFKFVHNHVDKVYFADLIKEALQTHKYDQADLIIYPPIRFLDRIMRGPNHAYILAQIIARYTGFPLLCPFQKSFFAGHQAHRNKSNRSHIREEYSFLNKYASKIQGKNILFIDDLITTGYTVHTLAQFLKKAGACCIYGYFLASEKTE